jgi:hypothetical protein
MQKVVGSSPIIRSEKSCKWGIVVASSAKTIRAWWHGLRPLTPVEAQSDALVEGSSTADGLRWTDQSHLCKPGSKTSGCESPRSEDEPSPRFAQLSP